MAWVKWRGSKGKREGLCFKLHSPVSSPAPPAPPLQLTGTQGEAGAIFAFRGYP